MSAATDSAKALNDLLKKLGTPEPIEYPDAGDPVSVLVMSMLLWESTTPKALAAYQKLKTAVVDFNELRVCMPQELIDCLGVRYPLGRGSGGGHRYVDTRRDHALAKRATAERATRITRHRRGDDPGDHRSRCVRT